jgi:hypothetical protein
LGKTNRGIQVCMTVYNRRFGVSTTESNNSGCYYESMPKYPRVPTAGAQLPKGARNLPAPSTRKAKPVSLYRRQTSRPPLRIHRLSQRSESAQVPRHQKIELFQVWTPPPVHGPDHQ